MPTTPKQIDETVLTFASEVLVPGAEPVIVRVETDPDSGALDCFGNVERRIERAGGGRRYGWAVWQHGTSMIEGEFHSVWIAPNGRFVDVTPHDGETEILFVPDSSIRWETHAPKNRRRALLGGPTVERTMQRLEQMDAEREAYYANPPPGVIFVEPPLHRARIGRNDKCPCNSDRKYKKCCERISE
jgi:SEC-C motif